MFKKKKKDIQTIDFDEEEERSEEEEERPEEEPEEETPILKRAIGRPKQELPELPHSGKRWVVKEVPLQIEKVILDQKTNKAYDLYSAITELLNRTE